MMIQNSIKLLRDISNLERKIKEVLEELDSSSAKLSQDELLSLINQAGQEIEY